MFSRVTNKVSPSDELDESGFGHHKENSICLTALSQVWWKDDYGAGSFFRSSGSAPWWKELLIHQDTKTF